MFCVDVSALRVPREGSGASRSNEVVMKRAGRFSERNVDTSALVSFASICSLSREDVQLWDDPSHTTKDLVDFLLFEIWPSGRLFGFGPFLASRTHSHSLTHSLTAIPEKSECANLPLLRTTDARLFPHRVPMMHCGFQTRSSRAGS